jgi:hypothetical protein
MMKDKTSMNTKLNIGDKVKTKPANENMKPFTSRIKFIMPNGEYELINSYGTWSRASLEKLADAPVTIEEKLKDILEENYAQEANAIRVHDAIAEVIKTRWQGKKLNKRIADQVKEKLGDDMMVSFYRDTSSRWNQVKISVWGSMDFYSYEKRLEVYLGNVEDTEAYTVEKFENHDGRYGHAAKERNRKRSEILNNPTRLAEIVKAIEEYNRIAKELKAQRNKLADFQDSSQISKAILEEI